MTGTWQGWLVTERSFNLINLEIRADGSFEVSGTWVRASGILMVTDGRLRFDGNWTLARHPRARGNRRAASAAARA